MTTEAPKTRTLPEQPAANSGGAVGFIIGALLGAALALSLPAQHLNSFGSPVEVLGYVVVIGTLSGALVGAVRDRLGRSD